MNCPKCGRVNVDTPERCDCGYEFAGGQTRLSYANPRSREDRLEQRRRQARRDMTVGGIFCLVGIVVTVATYAAASQAGGTYVVTWGAVAFGGFQFLRGLGELTRC